MRISKFKPVQRRIQGVARDPLFCDHLFFFIFYLFIFFCNHFEEIQTVLFEVELIISTINICLPKYYRNMFNTQSFVISQTIIIFF